MTMEEMRLDAAASGFAPFAHRREDIDMARWAKSRIDTLESDLCSISLALGLPALATTEQCVERAEELRKDGERLDWLEASEGEVSTEMIEDDPNDEDTDMHGGWACYATPLTAGEKRKVVSAIADTLRAALDAARGEKP